MKVKIIKKNIKEGDNYCIKSLLIAFSEESVYRQLTDYLRNQLSATPDMIDKFCKPSQYNDATSYGFFLTCSDYTFNKVERFGTLDAKIVFTVSKGFINARIQSIDRIEQVLAYESPESEATGWAVQDKQTSQTSQPAQSTPAYTPEPHGATDASYVAPAAQKPIEDMPF